MDQVIQVRLENKPGALMRVAGILTATGTNIESLVLSPDAYDAGVSNMTSLPTSNRVFANEWCSR